ncbi:MAG: Gfo/Idh/MocA family oxidoreductase [Kiritimatiellae bacterium]|nr:Gfo/Idh/MocA family oxidoreductase [Kiritimatiellia bacterium]
MKDGKLHIAVVGLGFGSGFVPIYAAHPAVGAVTICDTDEARLARVGEKMGFAACCREFEQVLGSTEIDAVHLATPVPLHAEQAVAVLAAGKHCACAVPMATSLADLARIVRAQAVAGKVYMMMETAVYTKACLFIRDRVAAGELGRLQLLRGAHYQDMSNWPVYWEGLPPMHYATHAAGPPLALAGCRAVTVRCLGSGVMDKRLHAPYGNPYPIEIALFELARPNLVLELTRTLFATAIGSRESFDVYGETGSFEWMINRDGKSGLWRFAADPPQGRGRRVEFQPVEFPHRPDLLPPELGPFAAGGHGGSHPHLVHEFVSSIVEQRRPAIDAVTSADWTAAGICAHDSAMRGGEKVMVPDFAT